MFSFGTLVQDLKTIFSKKEVQTVVLVFLFSRVIFTIIGVIAREFIDGPHDFVFHSNPLLAIWGVWDTGWYLDIARNGYSTELSGSEYTLNQGNYAFFPLYPLLVRVGSFVFQDFFVAGVVISNISLILSCVYLYKYVRIDNDKNIALWAVIFLLLSPVGFIFSGVFTESLYLFLVLAAFYFARQRRWFMVGVIGFFAALTRSVGALLVLPTLIEYMESIEWNIRRVRMNVLLLFLIPIGLLLYMLFNYSLAGDLFAFVHVQAAWGRDLGNPVRYIVNGFLSGDAAMSLNATVAVFVFIFLIVGYKKLRVSELVFGMYSIIVPLMSGLESMVRYSIVIFPLHILLARSVQKRWLRYLFALICILLQSILMLCWTTGFDLVK